MRFVSIPEILIWNLVQDWDCILIDFLHTSSHFLHFLTDCEMLTWLSREEYDLIFLLEHCVIYRRDELVRSEPEGLEDKTHLGDNYS